MVQNEVVFGCKSPAADQHRFAVATLICRFSYGKLSEKDYSSLGFAYGMGDVTLNAGMVKITIFQAWIRAYLSAFQLYWQSNFPKEQAKCPHFFLVMPF